VVELGDPVAAQLYGDPAPSHPVIGPWEDAISAFVAQPLTLLWADEHATDRGLRGGNISLVSAASLERLAEEGGVGAVDGRHFRMLLEIDGVEAHDEDDWLGMQVQVGDAVLVLNGDVGRCVATTFDPDTGLTDFDTLKVLAGYRREGRNEPLPFGVCGAVAVPGRVRIGDAVQPLQQSLLSAI
jgi:hypothetical protein